MRAEGKSTIVTGAGSGIGEGIARRLAAEGARLIVNDIDAAKGEAVAASIRATGGEAQFIQADMTRSADVQALVAG
ncbi:MAG: SDR family NAD(P)-dependent oxidoreductase, partial [Acidovorax sp.]|nr:SDR family NAD(P)-dependent oxidoreductase [Acidovorax sp.]